MATPVITGIRSPSIEIGETMCRFFKSPKWLVPSLPCVGDVYFAMCCVKMSRGWNPFTSNAPILRIIGASQSRFSSAIGRADGYRFLAQARIQSADNFVLAEEAHHSLFELAVELHVII